MPTPAEIIIRRRKALLDCSIGDEEYNWIFGSSKNCNECHREIESDAVVSVEVCLNGAHFGDLAVCFLCPHCDSLYYLHFRKHILSAISIFEEPSEPPVRRCKLIESGVNNLLEMSDEEFEELL